MTRRRSRVVRPVCVSTRRDLTIVVTRHPDRWWRRRYHWLVRTPGAHTSLISGSCWTYTGADAAAMRARANILAARKVGVTWPPQT